jgi:hypothetical protein
MALLTPQTLSLTGLVKTMIAAAAGGDTFANDGTILFFVKNGGASAVTVTINSQTPCNQGYDHDIVLSLAAGAEVAFPKLDPGRFNDTNGNVSVTYSAVTSVTVAAVKSN